MIITSFFNPFFSRSSMSIVLIISTEVMFKITFLWLSYLPPSVGSHLSRYMVHETVCETLLRDVPAPLGAEQWFHLFHFRDNVCLFQNSKTLFLLPFNLWSTINQLLIMPGDVKYLTTITAHNLIPFKTALFHWVLEVKSIHFICAYVQNP